jgi:hypothetical protein
MKMQKMQSHHWDKLESEMGGSPRARRMESPDKVEATKRKARVKRRPSEFL